MRSKELATCLNAILLVSTIVAAAASAAAQQETLLHSFPNTTKDGSNPQAALIFDKAGNLYGTAPYGGTGVCTTTAGCGIAFELLPAAGGGWTEKILHTFGNGTDGFNPVCPLIFDSAGNLYGTTPNGGTGSRGVVFELSPKAGGVWTEKILHNFNANGTDATSPEAGLIFDSSGHLYGTTPGGGAHSNGAVFELARSATGTWTEKVLFSFNKMGPVGYGPNSGVILDAAGNLYGELGYGSPSKGGAVFMLQRSASGTWSAKALHTFTNTPDGFFPGGGLIFDSTGNLYGTTSYGGALNYGTVFELTPAGATWSETTIYSFGENPIGDGVHPFSNLVLDASGNLFGTTIDGGAPYDSGAAFELTPATGGTWTEVLLYSFGLGSDGVGPEAGLIFDNAGNLYGTTYFGGADANGNAAGTVFEIMP